jgi:hypothetical protein
LHDFGGDLGSVGAIQDTKGNWHVIVDSNGNAASNTASVASLFDGYSCSDLDLMNEFEEAKEVPEEIPAIAISNLHQTTCNVSGFNVAFEIGNLTFDGVGFNTFEDSSCVLWTY